MKIVFLAPAAQNGGAEAVLLDVVGVLKAARPAWDLRVVAGEDGPTLARIREMGVACEVLAFPAAVRAFGEQRDGGAGPEKKPARRKIFVTLARIFRWAWVAIATFFYGWRLRRRLRTLAPDVLHSNGMKMHLLGALAKPPRTALVWHLHDYLGSRAAMRPILRRLSPRCALVIANSHSVAEDVRATLPGTAVEAVHNAVDLRIFAPEGPTLDLDGLTELPPASAGTVRVGLVATFARWKGHEVFLQAAAVSRANCRFYVVGGPVYATAGSQRTVEELRALAEELGLSGRVGFTGFVEDAPAAMRALDVVVHASTEPEPFGLVIVQALACARAVVVSAAGGARELVQPGVTALVHAPGDVQALAAAIDRLAADPPLRTRLGEVGRTDVERRFSRDRFAEKIVPCYEKAVANSQR